MNTKPTPTSWKPGQSGNPRGRPRNGNTGKDIFLKLAGGKNGRKYADQLYALACGNHGDPHVRLKALAIIGQYVWGKPTETVDLNATIAADTRVVHEEIK